MKKVKIALFTLIFLSGFSFSEPMLNESTIKAIGEEFNQAALNKDTSIFKKYLFSGSKIIVDMDPANNRGEKEVTYDNFMKMMKMSLKMVEFISINDELLTLTIDKEKNEATIEEKTIAVIKTMGMEIEDTSINKTTFGVINGEIKILITQDQLVSSNVVQ